MKATGVPASNIFDDVAVVGIERHQILAIAEQGVETAGAAVAFGRLPSAGPRGWAKLLVVVVRSEVAVRRRRPMRRVFVMGRDLPNGCRMRTASAPRATCRYRSTKVPDRQDFPDGRLRAYGRASAGKAGVSGTMVQAGSEHQNRRLGSWKEIAAFFDLDESTVRRWEKDRGLPVHRVAWRGWRKSVRLYRRAGTLAQAIDGRAGRTEL